MAVSNFDTVTANQLNGPLAGNVTGDVTAVAPIVLSAASGAIAIPTYRTAKVHITYNGGAGAYTIADPVAVTDDGKEIEIFTETAQAHVLTDVTSGFNLKGASGTVTWTAAIGNGTKLTARNGKWIVAYKNGVTVA
jgi:hypothetical protein